MYAALINNDGRTGLNRNAGFAGIQDMSSHVFYDYAKFLYEQMDASYQERRLLVAQKIRDYYYEQLKFESVSS